MNSVSTAVVEDFINFTLNPNLPLPSNHKNLCAAVRYFATRALEKNHVYIDHLLGDIHEKPAEHQREILFNWICADIFDSQRGYTNYSCRRLIFMLALTGSYADKTHKMEGETKVLGEPSLIHWAVEYINYYSTVSTWEDLMKMHKEMLKEHEATKCRTIVSFLLLIPGVVVLCVLVYLMTTIILK